jgi:hypothetical protein
MTPSRIAVVCIVALLPACGGGGGSPSTPTTLPPAPVTTVVAQGTFHLGDPGTALATGQLCDILAFVPFTTTATGTVAISVSWSHASNDLDIGLARGSCTCATALAEQCDEVASSDSATAKPETLNVSNLAAGPYTLAILNNGPGTEAGSYQVLLTH